MNRLPADNSHEIIALFCNKTEEMKHWKYRLLYVIGLTKYQTIDKLG